MKKEKIKKIISWIAIVISLAISSFWAYWGIQEFFHEGWYSPSIGNLLFLFFVQYMSFTIIFTALALIAMAYKKTGLISYILVGIFSAFFFNGASFEVAYLTLAIPFVVLGLLFYYGEFAHKRIIKWIMIGLPLLIIIIFGTPLLIRNINRLDDGNYGTRVLDCQDKQIVWAPRGYGFPDEGVNWSEAKEACSRLAEDGQTLLEESVNIWRLPSVNEAVVCQQKHDKNAGGIWDEQSRQAKYKLNPDKETPLWQPNSEIIYYWTAEMSQETDKQAYIFTYDGKIYDKDIRYAPNYQSFRCVKDYTDDREENNSSYFLQRDEAIEKYLLKQKEFVWQTESDTKNACVFENLSDEDSLFPLSLWVLCQEYKIVDGEVKILSGASGPVLLDYPNALSNFSVDNFAKQVPRDGKLYYEDIQNIFPENLQNTIYTYRNQDFLSSLFMDKALN